MHYTGGNIREIMDDVIAAGLAIWGGVSTQVGLPSKTPEQIREITRRTIDVMNRNGGYIAAPTHSVPPDVPVENLIAMAEIFEAY